MSENKSMSDKRPDLIPPEEDIIFRIVEHWGNAACGLPVMVKWLKEYARKQSSRFLTEYKQYKENLKYLGGPTEWTQDRVDKMNKVEVYEAIKGLNDLINFLDSVIHALEEGAAKWEDRALEAEKSGCIWRKDSYDRLYDQVKGGKRTVCYLDYNFPNDPTPPVRDVCSIRADLEFRARGIGYGGANCLLEGEDERAFFLKECERLNVEWLDESGVTMQHGAVWVKASEINIEYRKTYYAQWPSGTVIKSTGWFQESDGTFFWNENGYVPILKNERHMLLILDESGTPAAGSEENLKAEIERRNKLLEDDLKRQCRLNAPGISEQMQEAAWQDFKKRHKL